MDTKLDPAEIVGAIGDALIVSDVQGRVVAWNAAAERLFGWSAAEAMGQRMDMIIPERLRGRHWEGYHKTMASGITKYGTDLLKVPAVDKQGRAMSIAFTVSLLHGPDGKVNAIASVIRDETQRFNDERALRKRLAELESQLAAKA